MTSSINFNFLGQFGIKIVQGKDNQHTSDRFISKVAFKPALRDEQIVTIVKVWTRKHSGKTNDKNDCKTDEKRQGIVVSQDIVQHEENAANEASVKHK
ncbi:MULTISPECIES: hypothetical protein [Lacticaseibacillus]|uniref:hypothetical protein n=1 Tax=Lacticaseibacillus TaxID=2759736 RepID=UPI001300AAC5|nr:hypothetical protein [Lacticaseibacillus casei]MBI6598608.1 hypothetical protein [Lacticaseibacillus casei]MBO1482279.1 hypothetical protein [Lacticaseibacillus casei]MBO2417548.1 hypothetical protein [Lacticaseibacillus casei]MCK2081924.1 hypothetical protein [Lacticaseibacillus casei]